MPSLHKTTDEAGAYLIRTGYGWAQTPQTAVELTYGFRETSPWYSSSHNENASFSQMSDVQKTTFELVLSLWSDVANITFTAVNPDGFTDAATMLFANYNNAASTAGGFAQYPIYAIEHPDAVEGDVWINLYHESASAQPFGSYDYMTILHEVGHALGLEHPGAYNGSFLFYDANAEYVEDSQQYTVMSYFEAWATGARHYVDLPYNTQHASTPLLHDIAAMQALYGANMTARTDDTVYGFNSTAGKDVFDFAVNTNPVIAIWDAGGHDTLDASGFATDQVIDLRADTFSSIGRLTLNVSIAKGVVIEDAAGGSGSDIITGNAADNQLTGGAGNDTLDGGDGEDTATYAGSADRYVGLESNGTLLIYDQLQSGDGADTLTNIEFLDFNGEILTAAAFLAAHAPVAPTLELSRSSVSIRENTLLKDALKLADMTFTSGDAAAAPSLAGRDAALFTIQDGALYLRSGVSLDFEDRSSLSVDITVAGAALGGSGGITKTFSVSVLNVSPEVIWGSDAAQVLYGSSDADTIYGLGGNDTLSGGAGDDVLIGGAGRDFMVGGAGRDVFDFNHPGESGKTASARDRIADFGRGQDDIDLRTIDASAKVHGNQNFKFIGKSVFHKVAGELHFRYEGGSKTIVEGDVNGDGRADFQIELAGHKTLTAGDFIL